MKYFSIWGLLLLILLADVATAKRRGRLQDFQHGVLFHRTDRDRTTFTSGVTFEVNAPGIGYSLSFKDKKLKWNHSFRLYYLEGEVLFYDNHGRRKNSFFFAGSSSVIEVDDADFQGFGVYYSPKIYTGWTYGVGWEAYRIKLRTVGDGSRTLRYGYGYVDGGYQWVGTRIPVSFQVALSYPLALRMNYGYHF